MLSENENYSLDNIFDFDSLENLRKVFLDQYQNKYDFDLYIAPIDKEWKDKFEAAFLEFEQPYEKLFDSSFLKEAYPTMHKKMPLTLYVYLGEEQEAGLFAQTLLSFLSNLK